ncbi:MAG: GGDEF domain-containing protein [Pseudohongiellaceae bacterium]
MDTHPLLDPQQDAPTTGNEAALQDVGLDPDSRLLSSTDALTGLHGQRYLYRAIDECLKQSHKPGLTATLALLQLENFYEIRSWVGLSEADLLLTDIAQLLKKTLPRRVLLCRCHNYEFAALLMAQNSVNAGIITDKLKQALLSAVSPSLPRQLELKCAVGLAKLEPNIPCGSVVFARARHNLSLAHQHRQLPVLPSSIDPNIALKQLHAALDRSQLELNFQAWAHLQEGSPQHYEVRCSLAQQEDVLSTAHLFEIAARNALGEKVDQRVIAQLCTLLEKGLEPTLRLVVNLSHNSVVSMQFHRWLEQRLALLQPLASQLVFQISEIDALIAQHHLITFCKVIERLGSKVSLSNFGCTPNPLGYLSLVPASYVKLDNSILSKVDVNQEKLASLNKLSTQLHDRRICVVAPLLERLTIAPLLWQAKVDFLQGNCLHQPSSTLEYEFLETLTVKFGSA